MILAIAGKQLHWYAFFVARSSGIWIGFLIVLRQHAARYHVKTCAAGGYFSVGIQISDQLGGPLLDFASFHIPNVVKINKNETFMFFDKPLEIFLGPFLFQSLGKGLHICGFIFVGFELLDG